MRKILLEANLAPGDEVMLTAAVRDLHLCSPKRFLTGVKTQFPELWENNPHVHNFDKNDNSVELVP